MTRTTASEKGATDGMGSRNRSPVCVRVADRGDDGVAGHTCSAIIGPVAQRAATPSVPAGGRPHICGPGNLRSAQRALMRRAR